MLYEVITLLPLLCELVKQMRTYQSGSSRYKYHIKIALTIPRSDRFCTKLFCAERTNMHFENPYILYSWRSKFEFPVAVLFHQQFKTAVFFIKIFDDFHFV